MTTSNASDSFASFGEAEAGLYWEAPRRGDGAELMKEITMVRPSDLRKYGEEEVKQAIIMLRTKGDQFYCDFLRSVLFPNPEGINPPIQFFAYLLNSGLMGEYPTIEISFLKGSIYTHIQLNRQEYLTEMEQISNNLKGE